MTRCQKDKKIAKGDVLIRSTESVIRNRVAALNDENFRHHCNKSRRAEALIALLSDAEKPTETTDLTSNGGMAGKILAMIKTVTKLTLVPDAGSLQKPTV